MILDYIIANECKNKEVWYTCLKCGKCGRVFEDGCLVDDGGTTIEENGGQDKDCHGCFGASFNDCEICDDVKGEQK